MVLEPENKLWCAILWPLMGETILLMVMIINFNQISLKYVLNMIILQNLPLNEVLILHFLI